MYASDWGYSNQPPDSGHWLSLPDIRGNYRKKFGLARPYSRARELAMFKRRLYNVATDKTEVKKCKRQVIRN